jgi:CheY-like chemotaxis protein
MSRKILVVEDHDDSREILIVQLKMLGYQTLEATTGSEALSRAQAEAPDLILMDLGLPDMTGIEVARRLKALPETARIPIIAHTAWSREEFGREASLAGIADYLTKPTPARQLQQAIRRCLQASS